MPRWRPHRPQVRVRWARDRRPRVRFEVYILPATSGRTRPSRAVFWGQERDGSQCSARHRGAFSIFVHGRVLSPLLEQRLGWRETRPCELRRRRYLAGRQRIPPGARMGAPSRGGAGLASEEPVADSVRVTRGQPQWSLTGERMGWWRGGRQEASWLASQPVSSTASVARSGPFPKSDPPERPARLGEQGTSTISTRYAGCTHARQKPSRKRLWRTEDALWGLTRSGATCSARHSGVESWGPRAGGLVMARKRDGRCP